MDIYKLLDLYKATIDERRPFQGDMLAQIKEYYRIGLTWSSNAIERDQVHPVEFAAQLHKRFVFTHPFKGQ